MKLTRKTSPFNVKRIIIPQRVGSCHRYPIMFDTEIRKQETLDPINKKTAYILLSSSCSIFFSEVITKAEYEFAITRGTAKESPTKISKNVSRFKNNSLSYINKNIKDAQVLAIKDKSTIPENPFMCCINVKSTMACGKFVVHNYTNKKSW
jgi:hypothetical protein